MDAQRHRSPTPLLCYRCGSHVPDTRETCPTCGQKYDAASRQAAGGFSRRRAEDAPFKPGDVIALRYDVREVLGSGPLGFVFRAHDQDMDVEVALKVVHSRLVQAPEERTQFAQALRNGRKLTHPHLVRVYEEGLDGDHPYFTMQLLQGTTLRKMMEARAAKAQRFTPQEVESLLAQVASALDDAHRLGPHADLKPENIFILPDLVKVTDYGLGLGVPRLPFIQAQKSFRADSYLAPEYVLGGDFDTRMDLYSLAVIVGELLTGLTPSEGVPPELLSKYPDLPPGLEAFYRRALNVNPLARPKTAADFLREYSAVVAGRVPTVSPAGEAPVSPVDRSRAARPGASGAHSALSASGRLGDKPPPPVPTDQLPAVLASAQRAPPPSDATQPMDADAILRMTQQPGAAPDATQPMDAEMLAAIVNAAPPASGPAPGAPRPPGVGQAMPRAAPANPIGVAAPLQRRPEKKPGKPMLWLALLAVAGLVTGSAGAYFVLRGRQATQDPATTTGTPSTAAGTPTAAAAGACPAGMQLVPGGAFSMGTPADERTKGFDERPLSERRVPAFCIDEFEFPNVAGSLPRVNVSWTEAQEACEQAGKRLCAEEEWEKACKGPKHLRFPYGSSFDAATCNTEDAFGDDRPLAPSGKFPKCRSGYGVADLSGNVAEWTSTPYSNNADRTQKGGAFDKSDYAARCSARKSGAPTDRAPTVGFRCCSDVRP
jgi:serine/threonine protein kinase